LAFYEFQDSLIGTAIQAVLSQKRRNANPKNADVSNRYEVMAKPEAQTRTEIRKV